MKVTETIDLGVAGFIDIDVHISGGDIVNAFVGDEDGWPLKDILTHSLNNIASFYNKLPEATISELTPGQRQLIREFFEKQAKRFEEVSA